MLKDLLHVLLQPLNKLMLKGKKKGEGGGKGVWKISNNKVTYQLNIDDYEIIVKAMKLKIKTFNFLKRPLKAKNSSLLKRKVLRS